MQGFGLKLSHRLGQGISYDRLQRQLTEKTMQVCQQVDQDGVYTPVDTIPEVLPIFALDNLDGYRLLLRVEVSM